MSSNQPSPAARKPSLLPTQRPLGRSSASSLVVASSSSSSSLSLSSSSGSIGSLAPPTPSTPRKAARGVTGGGGVTGGVTGVTTGATGETQPHPRRDSSSASQLASSTSSLSLSSVHSSTHQQQQQQQQQQQRQAHHRHSSSATHRHPQLTLVPSAENVSVAVRVRPLSDTEVSTNQQNVWDVVPGDAGRVAMNVTWRERLRKTTGIADFQFDHVFVGSENESIYRDAVSNLVVSAMEGYNGTVFAYGQTSSGKTYTMMGNPGVYGVIPRAIEQIFAYISETSDAREFLLRVSYLEIYNEMIQDLLSPENSDLKIHEDKHRGTYVSPLREEIVTTPEQVMQVIQRGEMNRHVSTTDYNEHSSRSHTIFQVIVESRERPGMASSHANSEDSAGSNNQLISRLRGPVRISALNLIDLAGSEKASASADRRREGSYINRSLLTLGTVIARLTDDKNGHVPYRDSKLTRILQSSLQGNARVSVICTISPAMSNFEESTNTMKFAQRIKRIITRAATNEILDDKTLLQKYRKEIDELKSRLIEVSDREGESTHLAAEKLRLEEELHQQQLVRTALKERIDHLTKLILTSSSFNSQAILNTWQPGAAAASSSSSEPQRGPDGKPLAMKNPSLLRASNANMDSSMDIRGDGDLDRSLLENVKLRRSLDAKDKQIQLLLDELSIFKTGRGDDVVALHTKLAEMKATIRLKDARIAELEQEAQRMRMQSPAVLDLEHPSKAFDLHADTDRLLQLEHEIDVSKEQILDLESDQRAKEKTILSLTSEVARLKNNRNTGAAVDDGASTVSDRTANAQLLSNLLRPESAPEGRPSRRSSVRSSHDGPGNASNSTEQLLRQLETSLDKERKLRLDLEAKSHDQISDLETELNLTKAELSVSELLQTYAPQPPLPRENSPLDRRGSGKGNSSENTRSPSRKPSVDRLQVQSAAGARRPSKDKLYTGSEELQRFLKKLESGSQFNP